MPNSNVIASRENGGSVLSDSNCIDAVKPDPISCVSKRVKSLLSYAKNGSFGQVFITDTNEKRTKNILSSSKIQSNIFKLDKNELSNRINENNLVFTFLAKKDYPNKINIQITKANYFGKIYRNEQLYIIGSNGKLINYDADSTKDLPYFYGKFKREEFLKFSNIINNVGLKTKDISSFYFFPSGRWDIKFKDGLLLKLPNTNLNNVLPKAILLKKNQNFSNSKIIDLRIKNRIISNG